MMKPAASRFGDEFIHDMKGVPALKFLRILSAFIPSPPVFPDERDERNRNKLFAEQPAR